MCAFNNISQARVLQRLLPALLFLTRRHDRIRVPHVERGHVSDGEAVPRVHVGQADGALISMRG